MPSFEPDKSEGINGAWCLMQVKNRLFIENANSC